MDMAREYRPNVRESAVISKLDHAKESQRVNALHLLREDLEKISSMVATKLIEERHIETTSMDDLESQVQLCLEGLLAAEEFEIQLQTANIRTLVPRPNFISLYLTAFITEKLINHKCIVEMYGTDEDIYHCINKQVLRFIPK
jgi:hypothetical protein